MSKILYSGQTRQLLAKIPSDLSILCPNPTPAPVVALHVSPAPAISSHVSPASAQAPAVALQVSPAPAQAPAVALHLSPAPAVASPASAQAPWHLCLPRLTWEESVNQNGMDDRYGRYGRDGKDDKWARMTGMAVMAGMAGMASMAGTWGIVATLLGQVEHCMHHTFLPSLKNENEIIIFSSFLNFNDELSIIQPARETRRLDFHVLRAHSENTEKAPTESTQ